MSSWLFLSIVMCDIAENKRRNYQGYHNTKNKQEKKRSYARCKISIKDGGSNTVSHIKTKKTRRRKNRRRSTFLLHAHDIVLPFFFLLLLMCMCKLCCADVNVKRKEKGEGEKNDGRLLRRYKKKTKSSWRLIVQNAIEKYLFVLISTHRSNQSDDTEDYIGRQLKDCFYLYNRTRSSDWVFPGNPLSFIG